MFLLGLGPAPVCLTPCMIATEVTEPAPAPLPRLTPTLVPTPHVRLVVIYMVIHTVIITKVPTPWVTTKQCTIENNHKHHSRIRQQQNSDMVTSLRVNFCKTITDESGSRVRPREPRPPEYPPPSSEVTAR